MADTPARIKPLAFVLCDDIRREISGKDIFVGVYGGDMTVPEIPIAFPFALALLFEPLGAGHVPIIIEVEGPGGSPFARINADIDVRLLEGDSPHQTLSVVVGGMLVPIEKEGNIVARAKHAGDQEWSITRSLLVRRGPATPDIVRAPMLLTTAPGKPS